MDLQLTDQNFLVCGASSGLGRAVAERLIREGANIIVVARREEKLKALQGDFPEQITLIPGDLTQESVLDKIQERVRKLPLNGVLLNSGGPPALSALETKMQDWDLAYEGVMRWKINLVLRLIPFFVERHYGRILLVESQSIKQPIPSLVLSNAFRSAMAGFAKSLSFDVAKSGITVNLLAPGSHETPAIDRVIRKRSEETGHSYEEVKKMMSEEIPVGRMGKAEEFSSMAAWLMSPLSSFVTGQCLSHDGGNIKGLFG